MKFIKNYLKVILKNNKIDGTLYYVTLNSKTVPFLTIYNQEDLWTVLRHGGNDNNLALKIFKELEKMQFEKSEELDLFVIRENQSLGWIENDVLSKYLFNEIKNELIDHETLYK